MLKRILALILVACFLTTIVNFPVMAASDIPTESPDNPMGLKTENLVDPIGLDATNPRFSWLNTSSERGWQQSAYQIIVASTKEKIDNDEGDMWDSGKIESSSQKGIKYAGTALINRTQYWWKVRIWDKAGVQSSYSSRATFETGMFSAADWNKSEWISGGDNNILRDNFGLDDGSKTIAKARLYVTSLGYNEVYINGKKVGTDVLNPAYTQFDKRVPYSTYDITDLLNQKDNAIGIMLGNSYYKRFVNSNPAVRAEFYVTFTDGSVYSYGTDSRYWKATKGPITYDDVYNGERYDATKELQGWANYGYNDDSWPGVSKVDYSGAISAAYETTKVTKDITPVSVTEVSGTGPAGYQWCSGEGKTVNFSTPVNVAFGANGAYKYKQNVTGDITFNSDAFGGDPIEGVHKYGYCQPVGGSATSKVYIVDMGSNFAGWIKLKVSGAAGTMVTMRFSETLKSDGNIETADLRSAEATDAYILKGDGEETYEPKFTYHGFRYVEITGYPGELTNDNIKDIVTGRMVNSDNKIESTFTSSNSLINNIYNAYVRSQQNNMIGIPTDCPSRDERMPAGADAYLTTEAANLTFDMQAFYEKTFLDVDDSEGSDGTVPDVCPSYSFSRFSDTPWMSQRVLIPWEVYVDTGDKDVLSKSYDNMKLAVDHLAALAGSDFLGTPAANGDWVPAGSTEENVFFADAYFYRNAALMAKMAGELGNSADQNTYNTLANNIKNAFNTKYFNGQDAYGKNTQAGNAVALEFDLVPISKRIDVLKNLVSQVSSSSNHFTSGILGTKAVMESLWKGNRSDVAFNLMNQTSYPSFGYMLADGRGTLWERWDSDKKIDSSMNSFNHVMFGGGPGAWVYKGIAGISPLKPGYDQILIKPEPVGDLTSASGSVNTVKGTVSTSWTRTGSTQFNLNVTVPANSTAVISIPTFGSTTPKISEGGIVVYDGEFKSGADSIESLESTADNRVAFNVGSGTYSFVMTTDGSAIADIPAGYSLCAQDEQTVTFATPTDVAYGGNGKYFFLHGVVGPITFNAATFGGDPAYGVRKLGYSTNAPEPPKVKDIPGINVMVFDQAINNSRERELVRLIKPDLIHRGIYEWVGTELQDRGFDGFSQSIKSLQADGIAVLGGVSANWWAPRYETLADGVDIYEAGYDAINDANKDYNNIHPDTTSAMNQLIYKAKMQIDLGVDGIEFDEMYEKANADKIITAVREYAESKGKKIYLSCNNYDGKAGVTDYALWYYPYQTTGGRFDASANKIGDVISRTMSSPVPVFYFQDHAGSYTTGPGNAADYPAYLRSGNAQILAGGGIPGQLKSWMNSYDTYQNGCFNIQANFFKFMRENGELWHNLTYLNPSTLTSSADKVFMNAFGQKDRTVLHLVNGNFTPSNQVMASQDNFTVKISLPDSPSKIWMTTPDKLSETRKQELEYTYSDGVATITIPQLYYHDVVVIEQGGTPYNPDYSPMQVVFPFPNPDSIATGNKFTFNAVQTEGWTQTYDWYVNDIKGGNAQYGTIDGNGCYTAPASIPAGGIATIKAVSKDDNTKSASANVNIISAPGIGWAETFENDQVGSRPTAWQVVDGNGDWKISEDGTTKVLHNYNMSEGRVEQFQTGQGGTFSGALHEPMMVGGNNNWTDYNYSVSVKPVKDPYIWYGIDSEKEDTYVGLVFRFKDNKNYYVYRWCADGYLKLYKMVDGIETKVGSNVSCPFVNVGNYNNLSVNVNGSDFDAYVNGIPVRSDHDTSISNGAVGCLSNMMENYFSGISVNNAEAPANLPPDPSNLALGKTASSDSAESNNPASKGNDNDLNTRWCAGDSGENHWWKVDLGQNYNISGTQIIWEKLNRAYQYKVETSSDDSIWKTVADRTGNTEPSQTQNDSFTENCRYVRVTVTGGIDQNNWASILEVKVLPGKKSDATLKDLKADGIRVPGFNANKTDYTVALPYGTSTPPAITAEVTDAGKATAVVTQAESVTGSAIVVVTAEDGITTKTYTVNFTFDSPEVPTALTATASETNIDLSWNTVASATGYNVYRSTSEDGEYSKLTDIPVTTTSYVDIGLGGNTTYYYKVTAINAAGESAKSAAAAATTASVIVTPAIPVNLSATATGTSSINLNWTAVSGATGYNVYCAVGNGEYIKLTNSPVTMNSYTSTGLNPATTYYYKVTAVNSAGESERSTAAFAQTNASSGSGSTSGGSTSSGSTSSGSTGGTATPVSSDIEVKPVLSGSTANASVTSDNLKKALDAAKADSNGTKTVTLKLAEVKGAESYTLELPKTSLTSGSGSMLKVESPVATVVVPGNAFDLNMVSGDKVKLTIGLANKDSIKNETVKQTIGGRPVIDVKASAGGSSLSLSNPEAAVKVSLDYKPTAEELKNPEHITVWGIDENGEAKPVTSGRYDAGTGKVTFTANNFGNYAVVYVNKTFADIDSYAWAKKKIEVMAAKGVINGTSETTYSPANNITRADFIVLVVKSLGLNAKADDNFEDVKEGSYYYDAIAIAKKLGITTGVGDNKFDPKANISRQDMIVLAEKALRIAGKDIDSGSAADIAGYDDATQVAGYAQDAIASLVKEGIIKGSGNKLNPKLPANRAETAVIIYNLYNK